MMNVRANKRRVESWKSH